MLDVWDEFAKSDIELKCWPEIKIEPRPPRGLHVTVYYAPEVEHITLSGVVSV